MAAAHFALLFFVSASFFKSGVTSGFGVTCPDPTPSPLMPTVIPCNYDCTSNHGATQGNCTTDGNNNCICSGTKTTHNGCTYSYPQIQLPLFCQCAVKSTDIAVTELYAQICDFDCKCNHGAAGGVCNWYDYSGPNPEAMRSQCICDYPEDFTWTRDVCWLQAPFDVYGAIMEIYYNATVG